MQFFPLANIAKPSTNVVFTPNKKGPTSFLLRWGRRSFILTLIRWGFMNSVRTEPRMSFLPYSTRLSSPALKMRQTLSFSK